MYLNLVEVAESFGVSERVVEGWVRDEGLPHTLDRARMLFERTQVAQWAAERGLAARAGFLAPETPVFATAWRLEPLLRAGQIWRDVSPAEVLSVLERILAGLPGVTPPILQFLGQRLRAKGGISWAPVGGGFALPHLSERVALGRDSGKVALIFLNAPLPCLEKVPDGVPVTRLLFFIAPSPRAHLDLLVRFGRILMHERLRDLLARAASDELIFGAFAAIDAESSRAGGGTITP